jgi:hypothetical protein
MQSTIDFGMHLPVSHPTLPWLMSRTALKSQEDDSDQYVVLRPRVRSLCTGICSEEEAGRETGFAWRESTLHGPVMC